MCEFQGRKWTLFSLCVLGILVCILVASLGSKAIDDVKEDTTHTKEEWRAAKKLAKGILIASSVIGILFYCLGLFGAYKENYCLTLTFAILMTLATIGSIFAGIQQSSAWSNFVINLAITVLAYVLANDIKKLQRGGSPYTA